MTEIMEKRTIAFFRKRTTGHSNVERVMLQSPKLIHEWKLKNYARFLYISTIRDGFLSHRNYRKKNINFIYNVANISRFSFRSMQLLVQL